MENAYHTIFMYGNCMINIFSKKKMIVFYYQTVLIGSHSPSTNLFPMIFWNCMKIVWQAVFHTLDVWNCMVSIFGVWRSTRAASSQSSKNVASSCGLHLSKYRSHRFLLFVVVSCHCGTICRISSSSWRLKPFFISLLITLLQNWSIWCVLFCLSSFSVLLAAFS